MVDMMRSSATFFRTTATAPLFFALAPPGRAPPFFVCASVAVALKVKQVPSTGGFIFLLQYRNYSTDDEV